MLTEFLRHGSNSALILGAVVILVGSLLGYSALSLLWVLLGVLLFHLSEYTFHRFLFHAPPSKLRWVLNLQHRLHYDHHIEPNRLDLLFLPLWFAIPNLVLTGLATWAIAQDINETVSLLL